MNLRTNIQPMSGQLQASVSIELAGPPCAPVTDMETAAINAIGGGLVELGGVFNGTGSNGVDVTFVLPASAAFFPTTFPARRSFSISELGPDEAQARAETWVRTVESRARALVLERVASWQRLRPGSTSAPVHPVNTPPAQVPPDLLAVNWV